MDACLKINRLSDRHFMTYRSNKYTLKNDLTCFTIEYGFCFHTMRRALCLSEKEKWLH